MTDDIRISKNLDIWGYEDEDKTEEGTGRLTVKESKRTVTRPAFKRRFSQIYGDPQDSKNGKSLSKWNRKLV